MRKHMVVIILSFVLFSLYGCGFHTIPSNPSMDSMNNIYSEEYEQFAHEEQDETSANPNDSSANESEESLESINDLPMESDAIAEDLEPSPPVDRFGYGLFDSRLCYIRGEDPEFIDGVALKETLLYPTPSEDIYELGFIYPGRKIKILKRVDVGTYDQGDILQGSEWYLVVADQYGSIGYVKVEDIGNSSEISIEAKEPYQVKQGVSYYFTSSFTEPIVKDYPVGPLWVIEENGEAHYWKLRGHGGLEIYINDFEALEPCPKLGPSRNTRAG